MAIFAALLWAWPTGYAFSATSPEALQKIEEKNQQIQELQRQIEELQQQIDAKRGVAKTLQGEIDKLNAQIKQVQLEIQKLQLSINQVNGDIVETNSQIISAEESIKKHKAGLSEIIRVLNRQDSENLTEILLRHATLSDFFTNLQNVQVTQDTLRATIESIKGLKTELESTKEQLNDKRQELQQLRSIQEVEKNSLASVKNSKDSILTQTKGEEAKFQKLVQQSQLNIAKLRQEITALAQAGVTAEDAVKYGELAANRVGIRPEFLIAILEIESRLGQNVGKGNWRDDMYECYLRLAKYYPSRSAYYIKRAEDEKAAFLIVTSSLGINPDSVKVSAEPNYGCGGAMGPAQFIPTTWLAYRDRVASVTGHNPPSPWNIEDAFTASAIKLAAGGATSKTPTGEIRAAKAYVSGNPNCTSAICNSYSSAVLRKAEEIARNL